MSSVQAVFLFDINAFKASKFYSKKAFQEALLNLRLVCLRLLSEFSARSVNVRWGFKFFNSDGNFSQKMDKISFCDADLESYEKLEYEIGVRFERHVDYSKAMASPETADICVSDPVISKAESDNSSSSGMFSNFCPVKILHLALTQILCEYSWDATEICSPVKQVCGGERSGQDIRTKNYVFLISQCPADSASFENFFGRKCDSSFSQEILMPSALHAKFTVGACISLVWLDTSCVGSPNEMVIEEDEKVRQTVHRLLVNLSGALVPLQTLFQKHHAAITTPLRQDQSEGFSVPEEVEMSDVRKGENFISPDTLLPFSSLFNYYITNSCQYNSNPGDSSSLLVFGNTAINIKVMPTCDPSMRISKKSSTEDEPGRSHRLRGKRKRSSGSLNRVQNSQKEWYKFTVQSTVLHNLCIYPQSTYVCWPIVKEGLGTQHAHVFKGLLRLLSRKKLCLIVKCVSKDGSSAFGVLSYLSLVSATIVVFDSSVSLVEINSSLPTKPCNNKKKNLVLEGFVQKAFDSSFNQNVSNGVSSVEKSGYVRSKVFAMCTMEKWFVPKTEVAAIPQGGLNQKSSRKQNPIRKELVNLYKPRLSTLPTGRLPVKASSDTVAKEIRKSPRLKRSHSAVLNISKRSASLVERSYHLRKSSNESVSSDNCSETSHALHKKQKVPSGTSLLTSSKFTNEKDLLDHLNSVYNSALEPDGSLISSAQTLINVVMCFIQSKNTENSLVELENFVKKNFFLTVPEVNAKYDGCSDTGPEMRKKIKEYKMQVVLALELESILQPTSSEDCIEKVTGILRTMSFVAGPTDLNQFLYDALKTNYNHTLHGVLVEIGDELNVPFVSEIMSPSSVTDTGSSVDGPGSILSFGSLMSAASSSSVANNRNNGQRIRKSVSFLHGTSTSGDFQRRQILVPQAMLKRKRLNNSELVQPLRHSPRLAAKRDIKTPPKAKQGMKSVCRNLFDTEKNVYSKEEKSVVNVEPSSSTNDLKSRTSKGHHVLKTDYVSATPRRRQGLFLNKKLEFLRAKFKSAASTPGVDESPFKKWLRKVTRKLSVRRRFQRSCSFYGARNFGLVERLKLQENAANDASHIDVLSSMTPSKLLPDVLSSPAAKHPARNCSRKLFATTTPVKKQRTPTKNSASTENKKLHQRGTVEVLSHAEDAANIKHARENDAESAKNESPVVSSCHKRTPARKNEECVPHKTKILHNCSFTPPTPLGLLHLTTSPVVLLTRTKIKV